MSTAIFFNVPAHGHTNPTLPVVAELVKRGERIIYYSLKEFRTVIEHTGATFRCYGETPPDSIMQDENITRQVYYVMNTSQIILPRLLADIQEIKPDYIIHDSFCPWGKYVAQITNIPAISSNTMFVLTPRLIRSIPSMLITQFFMGIAARREKALIYSIAARLSAEYGIPKPAISDIVTNPEALNIVYTSKQFQPFVHLLDNSFKFVGPSLHQRPKDAAFPFEKLAENKPLIYISLGTMFNAHLAFFLLCCQAFANTDLQVVISTGTRISPDQLGKIPDNMLVRPTVPQLTLLQHTDVFITHAGMNSANEALYYGVPMIAIPQASDQPWVAQRIKQLGAGKVLHRRTLSAKKLRRSVEEILANPAYAQASAAVGKTLREAGGYQRAVEEILAFKHTHVRNEAPEPSTQQGIYSSTLKQSMPPSFS
jgi:MGT family glycosyltransferase